MKQFLVGLCIALLCGSTASAADWNCKAGKWQYNIFSEKLVVVTEDGDVYNYTCRSDYCVWMKRDGNIQVATSRIFYEKDNGRRIKPKEVLSTFFLHENNDVYIPMFQNFAAKPFTNCKKL